MWKNLKNNPIMIFHDIHTTRKFNTYDNYRIDLCDGRKFPTTKLVASDMPNPRYPWMSGDYYFTANGFYWDNDFKAITKYKNTTELKKLLCNKIPRAIPL
jgi:hypothetical protein